jgi:hypothetical protein
MPCNLSHLFSRSHGGPRTPYPLRPKPPRPLPDTDRTAWFTRLPDQIVSDQSLQDHDRAEFKHFFLAMLFKQRCTCNECSPTLYFNSAVSCPMNHERTDLIIEPKKGPITTNPTPELRDRYEALHLADSTIAYFSREKDDMSDAQLKAPGTFQVLIKKGLMEKLNKKDCSTSLTPSEMTEIVQLFNEIFFLSAITKNIEFSWELKEDSPLESYHCFGFTQTQEDFKGQFEHKIYMHPTRTGARMRSSLASARLGTVLHEMLHAFVTELACDQCCTAVDNVGGGGIQDHDRAWHRMAAALEERASDLLECARIDLGRLDELKRWYRVALSRQAAKECQ